MIVEGPEFEFCLLCRFIISVIRVTLSSARSARLATQDATILGSRDFRRCYRQRPSSPLSTTPPLFRLHDPTALCSPVLAEIIQYSDQMGARNLK